jgi:hypothetical protein
LFRHTLAQGVLETTGNLKVAQEILGHSHLSTTADLYLRVDPQAMVKALVAAKDGDDYSVIRNAIDALNAGTMRLAELMMDTAVTAALKGKTMDDADADLQEGPQAGHPVAKAEFK